MSRTSSTTSSIAASTMPSRLALTPSLTRLVAQTAVGALVQAAGVETIEPVLSRHTPGVPEVRMARETSARAECDGLHVSPSGLTFSGIVELQPEARDSHRMCAGAFVHSINAFGVRRSGPTKATEESFYSMRLANNRDASDGLTFRCVRRGSLCLMRSGTHEDDYEH